MARFGIRRAHGTRRGGGVRIRVRSVRGGPAEDPGRRRQSCVRCAGRNRRGYSQTRGVPSSFFQNRERRCGPGLGKRPTGLDRLGAWQVQGGHRRRTRGIPIAAGGGG